MGDADRGIVEGGVKQGLEVFVPVPAVACGGMDHARGCAACRRALLADDSVHTQQPSFPVEAGKAVLGDRQPAFGGLEAVSGLVAGVARAQPFEQAEIGIAVFGMNARDAARVAGTAGRGIAAEQRRGLRRIAHPVFKGVPFEVKDARPRGGLAPL